MKFSTIVVLVIAVFGTLFAVQNSKLLFSPKASSEASPVIVGPEEIVLEISDKSIPDIPYLTVNTNEGLIGVLSIGGKDLQRAYKVSNPLSSKLGPLSPITGIVKGTSRSDPDWGGVWLTASYREPNSSVIHGIYHSETHFGTASPNLSNDIWRAAYIRSNDGGQTWFKPNHPNNVLLTAEGNPQNDGISPSSLIKVGADFYLYYFENTQTTNRGMHVAKAPLSGIGNPASWKKYYCSSAGNCGFTEPGIGGKSTKLRLQGHGPVSYNTYLKKFLAVNGEPLLASNSLQLSVSNDGIKFSKYGPLTFLGLSKGAGWVIVYPNLIGKDGVTTVTSQNFYLYYAAIKWSPITQKTTDPTRYLMRRLITISGTNPEQVNNKLNRLYNKNTQAHLYTLSNEEVNSAVKEGYVLEGTCCSLFSVQIPDTIPLLRVESSNDVFMETNREQIQIAESYGYKNRTTVGYCYPRTNAPSGTIPLYRLYNTQGTDHYYTISLDERNNLISKGWANEGIVCNVTVN